jgi:hypothetical protein
MSTRLAPTGTDTVWLFTESVSRDDAGAVGVQGVALKVPDLKDEWKRFSAKLVEIFDQQVPSPTGFAMNAIDVSLLLEASGKIGFFTEVSGKVAATFKVTFTRKP